MKADIAVAGVITLITLLALGVFLTTGSEEYSRNNYGWNGTSEFFALTDHRHTHDIADVSALSAHNDSLLLIIAPVDPYTGPEAALIREYVMAGNTLLIADEGGAGNAILEGIGSSMRIQPGLLGSIDRAYNDTYVAVTTPDSDHPLVRNITSLVMDRSLTISGGEPLVRSGIMGWIDTDGNHRISSDESFGRRVVMAREEMGGEVILLADASIFINSMLDVGDEWGNRELVRRLVAYRPTLLVEQLVSMTAVPEGPGRLVHHLRNSPDLQVTLILLMLTLPAWILLRQPAFLKSRDEMSEEDAESPPACTGQESTGNGSARQTHDDPGGRR